MRRIFSIVLAATLAATAPGFPFYRALSAQTMRGPLGRSGAVNTGRGAPAMTGRNLNLRPGSVQFNRSIGVPSHLALPQSVLEPAPLGFAAQPNGQPIFIGVPEHSLLSPESAGRQDAPQTAGEKLADLRKQIQPQIEAARKLASVGGSAEGSNQAGLNIELLLQGMKTSAAFGDVPGPVVGSNGASNLEKTPMRSGSQLDQPITELTFVVADLETTGFYGEVNRPTEIGAVKIRFSQNGMVEEIGTFDQKTNPGMPVPAIITDFTGITNGDVQGQPTVREGVARFQEFAGPNAIHVFQNAPFDAGFLGKAAEDFGLPSMSNLIIDTKKMVRSLYKDIENTKLEYLIHKWGIGKSQDHTGFSEARLTAKVLEKLVGEAAKQKNKAVGQLTLRDLGSYTSIETFRSIVATMAPKVVEKDRQVPLPADFMKQADKWSRDLHKAEKPSMLRDIAYAMGVAYSELRDAMADAAQSAKIAPTDAILAELRENPGQGWIFDYDKTLTDNAYDGLSTPTPDNVITALTELLKRGPVAVVSSRAFDKQPAGVKFENTIWEPLIKRIPEAVRGNLLFVGNVGGELIVFDSANKIIRVMQSDWGKDEKVLINKIMLESLAAIGVTEADKAKIQIAGEMNAQVVIRFPKENVKVSEAFSKEMSERFKANHLDYPILQNHEWVFFAKFNKEDAVRIVYPIMRERGFPVTEENLIVFGDHFRKQANGAYGVDAPMAFAFPKSRAFTVGDKANEIVPPNVRQIGITGSRGTWRAIQAIIEGLDRRGAQSPAKKAASRVFNSTTLKVAGAALLTGVLFGAGLMIGVPGLHAAATVIWAGLTWSNAAATAAAGIYFTIGLPQIISNHRLGWEATQYASLSSAMLWLSAAVYLSASFFALGSSPIWILSNLAGAASAAVTAYQIIRNNKDPELFRKSRAAILGAILSLPLVTAGVLFFPLTWATWGVYAGIAHVLTLNGPQILKNYQLYSKERRAPELNANGPALVVTGAALNMLAAYTRGDWMWFGTAFASLTTNGTVLAQIVWPKLKGSVNTSFSVVGKKRSTSKKPRITDAEATLAGHNFMKGIEEIAHLRPLGRISQGEYNERETYSIAELVKRGATKRQIELFRKAAAEHPIPGGMWSSSSSLD